MTGTADALSGLVGHLGEHLGDDPAWQPVLKALDSAEAVLHLAVFTGPFPGWLLDGSKTIESRFSRVRCAPWGVLHEGDIVAVKKAGGPVTGVFQAGQVRSYQLTPRKVTELREQFATRIRAAGDDFWDQRADCNYATLADVTSVRALPPLAFPKRDRRGWAVLTSPGGQATLL